VLATSWKQRILISIATCGGFGYSPIVPGTMGALWGIPIYLAIALSFPSATTLQAALIFAALAVTCWITIALGGWAEEFFQKKDSGAFVTDEVAGLLFTLLLFPGPLVGSPSPWMAVLWGFPITRVIDILKIPPARQLEHLPKGWGVLADDLMGSIYAAGVLHLMYWIKPDLFAWPF
jgi:phosphatidylglycerophosphatase A